MEPFTGNVTKNVDNEPTNLFVQLVVNFTPAQFIFKLI